MGNATEWFDYGVYAATATYLTDAFFPGELGTLGTMLGFAISFVLRPLGGMVWGPLGDRIGRKAVLATTILLMAAATGLIGVLPTHGQVGVIAPILLILLRVIQGFSTGGEYGGAATYLAECATDRKRGFLGSFLEFGTLGGFVGGSAVVLACQLAVGSEAMHDWGWRIPFLLAIPLGLIGWYLRAKLDESPVFTEVAENPHPPTGLRELIGNYPRELFTLAGLVVALNVVNYTLLTYQPTYLQKTIGLDESTTTTMMLIGQLVMMVCIPFFGGLSDRVGRRPLWLVSLVGLAVLAVPMYWLMGVGTGWAVLGFVVLGLFYIPQLATISATFPAIFPTHVRYAGFALGYNVSTAVFGGTAPLVNEAVIESTGWSLFPAFYMIGATLIGLVAWAFLRETAGTSIRGTEVPDASTDEIPVTVKAAAA
ncbi:MFS transporter [Nocardia cyriacigeorgica]|uniref:MFS transporter n=1 Tax=Nocardia cyriacigeorgica TaxID=135487 RepID=UPI000567503A|nr:MFS transporter [Nocardia cyriacigeorgica]AVH22735.1 MFS transporter [Nocardia cyriacigeorgica]MBF6089386.1 MFS transporter [Nocardia cyriacigeorgica]MBF6094658.1 MFS transporter [Nocardia cyriacigeorgica]MBF6101822.1 MFS transporter [Nocardia cyriacigeorgica]MBF6158908.1 MFS transporter [Nocardia cyriacigeorgica]